MQFINRRAGSFRAASFRAANNQVFDLRHTERATVRLQSRGDGVASAIRGLASVFYQEGKPETEYWLWSDTVERIHPGAFDRAISENHDARGLFNHDASQLLGRVSAETCRLSIVAEGLQYEIDGDANDPDHCRVAAKIDRGDVNGSSFAFVVREVQWTDIKNDDGSWTYVRNIYDLDLYDVGPVTWPAYQGTTAGRSNTPGQRDSDLPSEIRELMAERKAYFDSRRRTTDVDVRLRLIDLD